MLWPILVSVTVLADFCSFFMFNRGLFEPCTLTIASCNLHCILQIYISKCNGGVRCNSESTRNKCLSTWCL
ncbi:hypothetical protein GLYMA_03G081350v4 [Glycine max]|nr:hypothetical protein GLYMA_03G081350v4 [Glycine max]KAH1069076.1 hypothetical protein GYH30_006597 [Glycine max]